MFDLEYEYLLNVKPAFEFLPEICWEEVAEEIYFVLMFNLEYEPGFYV